MKPVIEVKGISKSYIINHKNKASYSTVKDDVGRLFTHPFRKDATADKQETFWALNDVSFSVNPGEIFGIIGRNGSGKSTLLKILSRIVEPTSGEAVLRGRVASLLEVGTGFNPELTGRENIYFNGSMLGMSKREITKKFNEIVAV
jgi:lipopolysaccharide transport system ATP-binding protein